MCSLVANNAALLRRGCVRPLLKIDNHKTSLGGSTLPSSSPISRMREPFAPLLVGSRPPPNDTVWEMAKRGGFEVITHDRDAANKEKAVDTELVARGHSY
jgi:hypothetical protein